MISLDTPIPTSAPHCDLTLQIEAWVTWPDDFYPKADEIECVGSGYVPPDMIPNTGSLVGAVARPGQ